MALAAAGCGGVSNLPAPGSDTPPGQYQVTATATVGKYAQGVSFGLTVR